MIAADMEIPEGSTLVDLTEGAYDSLYDSYHDITFTALIPESEEGPLPSLTRPFSSGTPSPLPWSPTAVPARAGRGQVPLRRQHEPHQHAHREDSA